MNTIKLDHFKQAIDNLDEVMSMEKTSVVRDSAIKRYEICYELSWKIIQEFLKNKGIEVCKNPRDCFKQGFYQGLIEDELSFSKMIKNRNLTTHTYDNNLAESVYIDIKEYLTLFKKLLLSAENE
jgi:nucleotidyltransferase substrate binding protein (TIGR01987 family)